MLSENLTARGRGGAILFSLFEPFWLLILEVFLLLFSHIISQLLFLFMRNVRTNLENILINQGQTSHSFLLFRQFLVAFCCPIWKYSKSNTFSHGGRHSRLPRADQSQDERHDGRSKCLRKKNEEIWWNRRDSVIWRNNKDMTPAMFREKQTR